MSGNMLELHARELVGASPNWEAYLWESIGMTSSSPGKLVKVTGAEAPLITRGPRKGERNWRKMNKATKRDAYITPAEHEAWCAAWSAKTGKCHHCSGEGEIMKSWHHETGKVMRPCEHCGGTGKASDPVAHEH